MDTHVHTHARTHTRTHTRTHAHVHTRRTSKQRNLVLQARWNDYRFKYFKRFDEILRAVFFFTRNENSLVTLHLGSNFALLVV